MLRPEFPHLALFNEDGIVFFTSLIAAWVRYHTLNLKILSSPNVAQQAKLERAKEKLHSGEQYL
jgi:hypothetical protein